MANEIEIVVTTTNNAQAGLSEAEAAAHSTATSFGELMGEATQASDSLDVFGKVVGGLGESLEDAQAALDQFGDAEIRFLASTDLLITSEGELSSANRDLFYTYQQVAAGADMSSDAVKSAMSSVISAETGVTASTKMLIDAQTQLNLAMIQNQTGFIDDSVGLRGLSVAADAAGLSMSAMAADLEEGSYAFLDVAAASAKVAIQDNLLVEAQQQLAAANITLLETFEKLAAGEEVSAEAQQAALSGVSSAERDVSSLGGSLAGAGKEAETAGEGFGSMAGMMGGPWMMAIYVAMAALPLLGSAMGDLVKAFEPAKAITLDMTALGAAIQTDGSQAATATAALVAQSAVTDGLAASAQRAGVSVVTWTEAVMGNVQAQAQITGAVDKLNESQLKQAASAETSSASTGKFSDELKDSASVALSSQAATNKLTDANQQLLSSMQAQNEQITKAITQQTMLSQATIALDSNTKIMNASMADSYAKMQLTSLQGAITSVGLLNLGNSQSALNEYLVKAESAYSNAGSQASAYNNVLQATNGSENALLGTQAAVTISINAFTQSLKANGNSLNVNTVAGAQNVQSLAQVASNADRAAVAIYQNDVANNKASQAYNDANNYLNTQKNALIQQAEKAGESKNAVASLANQLFALPNNITSNVNVNTSNAQNNLNNLSGAFQNVINKMAQFNGSSNDVPLLHGYGGVIGGHGYGGIIGAAAGGGAQGGGTLVGENGPEIVNLPAGSSVMPNSNFNSMFQSGFGGGEMRVVLELTGGDSDFLTFLRRIIRVRAGGGPNSVQTALGYGGV